MEVAATCLYLSQPVVPHSPPSQALASAISSPSSKRRTVNDRAIVCRIVRQSDRSILFGNTSKLSRTSSSEIQKFRSQNNVKRSISACFDDESLFDEEFAKKLQELVLGFNVSGDDNNGETESRDKKGEISGREEDFSPIDSSFPSLETMRHFESAEPPWLGIRPEPPEWSESDEIIPASVERKANSVELPLSLRILKRKKQWQEGFRDAGKSTYCSVKKAFSSMVFIIREIQSYTLQMREVLFYEDLQGILERVQKEMHASFVWLFQQIFSSTPTLMVYVMILLANFTVYSMGHNAAIAAVPPPESYTTATEMVTMPDIRTESRFDPLSLKSFSVSGKTASIGGCGGGRGKVRPVAGATDGGDGWFEESSNQSCTIVPDGMSSAVANPAVKRGEMAPGSEAEREVILWNTIVEEASKMQAQLRDETLDHETVQRFVSPVKAEMEPEDGTEFFRTELMYRHAVSQEPDNALLLSNYALFLYLVVHDHDRAEEYFKRAIRIEPPDAESLSRYASFLWLVRKDMDAAEETYLNAIEADPGNTYHAGNYAHFLWNTGGEDTCYPL